MRQLTGLFALVLLSLSTAALTNDEFADGRAMIQAARQEMFRAELHMTDEEAEKFWPIYSTYREEYDGVMRRYGDMITDYVRRYNDADLSDEYADEMLKSYFGIKEELLHVQQRYLPELHAILPALKVARFYQLENKFNAEIDAQLARAVPLIDPS
ncbi:MAG: hypothetical protein IIB75_09270 [Proteobacteria bacterium]|nr:hypothetical protein [Pseudomonadota bacterium]